MADARGEPRGGGAFLATVAVIDVIAGGQLALLVALAVMRSSGRRRCTHAAPLPGRR
jgi:hypothetical protein